MSRGVPLSSIGLESRNLEGLDLKGQKGPCRRCISTRGGPTPHLHYKGLAALQDDAALLRSASPITKYASAHYETGHGGSMHTPW